MTASKYGEKPVDKWTVNDFIAYLANQHAEKYGADYVPPGRNWQAERGLIGGIIGTRGKNAKPRKHEPAVLKGFIDQCFATHRVSAQYPTVNFTWWWKWRAQEWARIVAEHKRKQAVDTARKAQANEDLIDWF